VKTLKRTNALIVICIFVSLFYWSGYRSYVEEYLVYSGDRLKQGALWTPISTLFVHFDPMHLIGNIIFLYVFGKVVEEEAGANAVTIAYFLGGAGSIIFSSFFYGFNVQMIGASGAIFTLSAAAMLIKPLKSSVFFLFVPLGLVAILYFIFNVFAVSLSFGGNVGYVTHVAGFLIGTPFGIVFSKGKWLKNLGITMLLLIVFFAAIYIIQTISNPL